MATTVWLYALIDPRDKLVRYVGQCRFPKERRNYYERCVGSNLDLNRWLMELKSAGLKPKMIRVARLTTYSEYGECLRRRVAEKGLIEYLSGEFDLLNIEHHPIRAKQMIANRKRRKDARDKT